MGRRVFTGARLAELLAMALPLCQRAERLCPRKGRGRPPDYPDWLIAMLIMAAVLKRRKTKSAQYRFLQQNRDEILGIVQFDRLPSRGTYFARYRRAHRLFQAAIRLQGQKAVKEGLADACSVAVDKSVLPAQGPAWSKRAQAEGRTPRGVDREAMWTYSKYHGWVYGYSYEVVVSAGKKGAVFPLLASADAANVPEATTFPGKIAGLPESTKFVLADKGYDSNQIGEMIEWNGAGRRTGRRFLCPQIYRRGKNRRPRKPCVEKGARRTRRQRRDERHAYLQTPRAKKLYTRRSQTVEPFNQWFKSLFGLGKTVWHRGADNNRTQLLAGLFAYQLLVRYNHRRGNHNGEIQWILDAL